MGEPAHVSEDLTGVLKRLGDALATDDEIRSWETGRALQLRHELLTASGIAEVLSTRAQRAIVADDLDPTRSLHWVRTWVMGSRPILGLFGPTDAGKTVAAAWALARVPGRYFQSTELALERKASFGRPSGAYEAARRCGLLVIDELGAEDDAALAAKTIEDILNRRQKTARKTLLLGNIDRRTLTERYGDRVWSRIVGVGRALRVDKAGFRARGEG